MSLTFSDLGGKIIVGVAIACVGGGGSVVLGGSITNATQNTEIRTLKEQQKETLTAVKSVTDKVDETNKKIERLLGRLEGRRDGN